MWPWDILWQPDVFKDMHSKPSISEQLWLTKSLATVVLWCCLISNKCPGNQSIILFLVWLFIFDVANIAFQEINLINALTGAQCYHIEGPVLMIYYSACPRCSVTVFTEMGIFGFFWLGWSNLSLTNISLRMALSHEWPWSSYSLNPWWHFIWLIMAKI